MRTPFWLSSGFRPFFPLGALCIAVSILIWVPLYLGLVVLPTAFSPRDWHIHMLLFGGIGAIIAGFLLTAVANWTSRPSIGGWRLAALVVVWAAGRAAISVSAGLNLWMVAAIDLAFYALLAALILVELLAAKNNRNIKIVAILILLLLADAAFHVEIAYHGSAQVAWRAGLGLVILLNLIIGGRIIPTFTRNWLTARWDTRLPALFNRLDAAVLVLSAVALIAWAAAPDASLTAVPLALAGGGNFLRMARWRGLATWSEPLLLVLHLAWGAFAAGFWMTAAASLGWVDLAASPHLWTAGAIGLMTIAVMIRATKGHSGLPLKADWGDIAICTLITIGTLARLLMPILPERIATVMGFAALSWAGGYIIYFFKYNRLLLRK